MTAAACVSSARGRYDDFDRDLPERRDHVPLDAQGAVPAMQQVRHVGDQSGDAAGQLRALRRRRLPPGAGVYAARDEPRQSEMRPMSAFENFEWTPSVADDGRILYARWDYIDRFNGYFFSLWLTNPDGAKCATRVQELHVAAAVRVRARAIPHSQKLIFTATAHRLHHRRVAGALGPHAGDGAVAADHAADARGPVPRGRGLAEPLLRQPVAAFGNALPGCVVRPPAAAALRGERRSQPGQCPGHLPLRRLWQLELAPPRRGDFQPLAHPVEAGQSRRSCRAPSAGTARRKADSSSKTYTEGSTAFRGGRSSSFA